MGTLGGTKVIAPIRPNDSLDQYPSHEAIYGKGGWRTVNDLAERSAISTDRREAGMIVYVTTQSTQYQLAVDLSSWSIFPTAAGSGGAAVSATIDNISSIGDVDMTASPVTGQVLTYISSSGKWQAFDVSSLITSFPSQVAASSIQHCSLLGVVTTVYDHSSIDTHICSTALHFAYSSCISATTDLNTHTTNTALHFLYSSCISATTDLNAHITSTSLHFLYSSCISATTDLNTHTTNTALHFLYSSCISATTDLNTHVTNTALHFEYSSCISATTDLNTHTTNTSLHFLFSSVTSAFPINTCQASMVFDIIESISGICNVVITTPSQGDVLTFDTSASGWIQKAPGAAATGINDSSTSVTQVFSCEKTIDIFVGSTDVDGGVASSTFVGQFNMDGGISTPSYSKSVNSPVDGGDSTTTGKYFPKNNIYSLRIPGQIIQFAGSITPTGFLLADGAAISRSTYSDLYNAIGTLYGAGDSATTFNLPDLRGIFVKGAGTTNRTAGKDANGNFYAATLGTYDVDHLQGHYHDTVYDYEGTGGAYRRLLSSDNQGTTSASPGRVNMVARDMGSNGSNGTPRTATVTEPQNIALNYYIQY